MQLSLCLQSYHRLGIQVDGMIVDTMIAASLIDENRYRYDLNGISRDYLGKGKDETLFALKEGTVSFESIKRNLRNRKRVNIVI